MEDCKARAPRPCSKKTGWARSVGGAAPYLTLFARAGVSREAADAAVAALDIHELPAARGCTYVLPKSDFAFALHAASGFDGDMKTAAKLGLTEEEIARLCEAVVQALANGPMDPDEIRQATGSASRSLGEEGKKKGMTTTLPLALAKLQVAGEIRRVPLDGRLDRQRYRYGLWRPNPLQGLQMEADQVPTELARRYFRWIGPATLSEFQGFSGFGAKAAKAAVEPLKLVPLDEGDARLMFPEDLDQLRAFQIPRQAHYTLTAGLDGLTLLKRNTKELIDAADLESTLFRHKAFAGGNLADLPTHGIFDRGRLVGLWEFDTFSGSIAWASFIARNKDLQAAVQETEDYVKTQLGDARSFSLDSPKSRAPRVEALREAK